MYRPPQRQFNFCAAGYGAREHRHHPVTLDCLNVAAGTSPHGGRMTDQEKLNKPLADKDFLRSAPDWWRDNGYDPQDDDEPPLDAEMDDFIRGGK
jgi:hypothetical protein